jgi:hypothetical protein
MRICADFYDNPVRAHSAHLTAEIEVLVLIHGRIVSFVNPSIRRESNILIKKKNGRKRVCIHQVMACVNSHMHAALH